MRPARSPVEAAQDGQGFAPTARHLPGELAQPSCRYRHISSLRTIHRHCAKTNRIAAVFRRTNEGTRWGFLNRDQIEPFRPVYVKAVDLSGAHPLGFERYEPTCHSNVQQRLSSDVEAAKVVGEPSA